jgi:hypothetical protein
MIQIRSKGATSRLITYARIDIRVRLLSVNANFLQQSSSAKEHRSNKSGGGELAVGRSGVEGRTRGRGSTRLRGGASADSRGTGGGAGASGDDRGTSLSGRGHSGDEASGSRALRSAGRGSGSGGNISG